MCFSGPVAHQFVARERALGVLRSTVGPCSVCFCGSFIVVCAHFTVHAGGIIRHQAVKDVVRPLLTVRALWLARGVVVVVAIPPLRAYLTLRRHRLFAEGALSGRIATDLFGYE